MSSDPIDFFPPQSPMMKVRGRYSNRKAVKQAAKKWHVRAFVTLLVLPSLHARSRERFEVLMISRNHSVHTWPAFVNRSNSRPLRSVEFQTRGASDVIPAASSSPEVVWPFLAICLTVFLFEFWPQTFAIKICKKACKIGVYNFGVQFSSKAVAHKLKHKVFFFQIQALPTKFEKNLNYTWTNRIVSGPPILSTSFSRRCVFAWENVCHDLF